MNVLIRPTPTIDGVLQKWVHQQPEKRLYAFLDAHGRIIEDLTYFQFSQRVDTLAAHLAEYDWLKEGDRVILSFQPGIEIIAALFACAKVGLVAVPAPPLNAFDVSTWANRMDHILMDSSAAAWLVCGRTRERYQEIQRRNDAPNGDTAARGLKDLPLICTSTLTTNANAKVSARHHPIAFQQYTSGSTSNPKGVRVSHDNLIANCLAVVDHEHPIAVTWLPQHHDMGLIGYYIYIAMSGGTTFGFSPRSFIQNPSIWFETMSRYRATATSVPNFALELCLNERRIPNDALEQYDLSTLRFLMVAAEPVSPETFEAFRNRFARCGLKHDAFFVAFGLAEFTLAVTSYGKKALSVDRRRLAQGQVSLVTKTTSVAHALPLMSCGRPLGDSDLRIVDPATSIEVPNGFTGEIWVSGAGLTHGYWNKLEENRKIFEAKITSSVLPERSFLRTGDIGFLHDGELFVCGRFRDMIIIRGQNIYPEDIEALAKKAYPELRGNAVVAFRSGGPQSEGLTLVAEAARGRDLPDEKKIVRVIREGLQIPAVRVVLVEPKSVPRTSSGKVRRAETRTLHEAGLLPVLTDTQHSVGNGAVKEGTDAYEIELLKDRYSLSGDEDFTLIEAGIDSLDLVVFLSWIKDNLIERDEVDLAARVNPRMLSTISIRDLFAVVRHFESAPHIAGQMLSKTFSDAYDARLAEEQARMSADKDYKVVDRRTPASAAKSIGCLVTGGTGFLGPFLIDAMLRQTEGNLSVLVRGMSLSQARQRLSRSFFENVSDLAQRTAFEKRVNVVLGDLEAPNLGLDSIGWQKLAERADAIYHNGAMVNYLHTYDTMHAANVAGTAEVLRLCFEGRNKVLNYISTTFIFGWASSDFLNESDCNPAMDKLDFGYSQSKWVAEQNVLSAMENGLDARVFRPALVTPGMNGGGGNLDITIRLLSFMIKHRLGVTAGNQVSFMPADITADNIVAIAQHDETLGQTFHVVRDELETMEMITTIIAKKTGTPFEMLDLPAFVQQVIRRCTRADPLYPLLDFLVDSVDNISSMEFKRYNSSAYQAARAKAVHARPDPALEVVIDGILRFLKNRKLL